MEEVRENVLVIFLALFVCLISPVSAAGADKLVVKNGEGATTFKVEDEGRVFTTSEYNAQSQFPGFWLDEIGTGYKGAYFVLDENWMQVQRRSQNFGGYEASPVFINIGAPHSSFVITDTGYVGFGKWGPSYPLHMASGAYVSSGGVWTNASSREYKTDIKQLTAEKAIDVLIELKPVEFTYKVDSREKHVGFIAEDVPELVATKDRKGMSSMDIVAVLTKVVQEQQKVVQEQREEIAGLSKRLAVLEKGIKRGNTFK